jgi:carboxymethylenebutenolidase
MDFYIARPTGPALGAAMVFHEAFGVTPHIRAMCHWLADNGYVAVAPDMFEYPNLKLEVAADAIAETPPATPMFSLVQNNPGFMAGRDLINALSRAETEELLRQTLAKTQAEAPGLKVAAIGYCWGGSLAYHAATIMPDVAVCSAYYGGRLHQLVEEGQPTCPTEIHMASQDRYMHVPEVEAAFTKHHPDAAFYVYDADHGFNRNDGKTYLPEAAQLARTRTLALFGKYLAPLA